MSDSDATVGPPATTHHEEEQHPTLGGKSLQSLERPRYKSWRKKYRKMRHDFDVKLEENKRLFKEEHRLEAMAKRLREELDGLLEMCLDLNQNPSVLPELRFDLSLPTRAGMIVPAGITPEEANDLLLQYKHAVQEARIPPVDLHVVRAQIEQRLAEQDAIPLKDLESTVPRPVSYPEQRTDDLDAAPVGFLTTEQETDYVQRLDAKIDPVSVAFGNPSAQELKPGEDDKHLADLTPRELERQVELLNPQSQHNWLKHHAKLTATGDVDDNESLASHDAGKAPTKKRGGNKNLAKQVGDRAVERAREGVSPGAGSGFEEDELSLMDEHLGSASSRKRARDPDSTYRVKGGGGRSNATKGKRKRSGEEIPGLGSASKKSRVEGPIE